MFASIQFFFFFLYVSSKASFSSTIRQFNPKREFLDFIILSLWKFHGNKDNVISLRIFDDRKKKKKEKKNQKLFLVIFSTQ